MPPGYNGLNQIDPSQGFLLPRAAVCVRNVLTRRDLREENYSTEKARKSLSFLQIRPSSSTTRTRREGLLQTKRRLLTDRTFSEMMSAMSFIAKWIEFLPVEIDSELTERNWPRFRTYNLHA
jgi:hypothetical protein